MAGSQHSKRVTDPPPQQQCRDGAMCLMGSQSPVWPRFQKGGTSRYSIWLTNSHHPCVATPGEPHQHAMWGPPSGSRVLHVQRHEFEPPPTKFRASYFNNPSPSCPLPLSYYCRCISYSAIARYPEKYTCAHTSHGQYFCRATATYEAHLRQRSRRVIKNTSAP